MRTSQALFAMVLAAALGAPIDTLSQDKTVAQPPTRAD
jgi:hypothetical protein